VALKTAKAEMPGMPGVPGMPIVPVAPVHIALAIEALDALLRKWASLKEKVASGTLSYEDMESVREGDWDLKRTIEGAVAVLAKASEVQALFAVAVPAFEAVTAAKDAGEQSADPPADPPVGDPPVEPEAQPAEPVEPPAGDPPVDSVAGDPPAEGDVAKSAKSWLGEDLCGNLSSFEQYRLLKSGTTNRHS
jgi:hypothetical protein